MAIMIVVWGGIEGVVLAEEWRGNMKLVLPHWIAGRFEGDGQSEEDPDGDPDGQPDAPSVDESENGSRTAPLNGSFPPLAFQS